ncbi:unnamed protein product [Allacma fusca]|uniref:C2H2-type domain-containing protein n=1 Tax=Allacma fusca TaxID=39272 RepID=A0A8J2LC53_9HEXA|nr:unnamed protein product [Allacma fusca]
MSGSARPSKKRSGSAVSTVNRSTTYSSVLRPSKTDKNVEAWRDWLSRAKDAFEEKWNGTKNEGQEGKYTKPHLYCLRPHVLKAVRTIPRDFKNDEATLKCGDLDWRFLKLEVRLGQSAAVKNEQDYSSNQLHESRFNEPVTVIEQYVHPTNPNSQYQPFYTERNDIAPVSGFSDGSSHLSIPSQVGYDQYQQQSSTRGIFRLPSVVQAGLNAGGSCSTNSIRQSPGLISQDQNDAMETHGCQLCKRKFCNPVNLLKHMKEFHHVDAAHVVGRRRALRQEKVGAERWQMTKLVGSPNTAYVTTSVAPEALISKNVPVTSVTSNPTAISVNSPGGHVPVSVVPYDRTDKIQGPGNSTHKTYCQIAPNLTPPNPILSNSTVLTPSQIKEAEELIVADIESFYCSKCYVRFTTRSMGETHARSVHFGEVLFFCLACNMEYPSGQDHSKLCSAIQRSRIVIANSDSGTPVSYAIITPVNTASRIMSNLIPHPVTPNELPPSSSEISSTSSDIFLPQNEIILPSSSNLPDREVTSQAGCSSAVEIIQSQSGNSFQGSDKDKAIDFERYISSNGILTEEQINFAGKMARKVIDGDGHNKFQCKICKNLFKQMFRCREHIRYIHLKQRYKCPSCEKIFETRKALDVHKPSHLSTGSAANKIHGTHITEPVGIHQTLLPAFIETYVVKTSENKWECKKCKKVLAAHSYAVSHVRQIHFSKCHRCNSCGLYFEEGLLIHRKKCNSNSQSVSGHKDQSGNAARPVVHNPQRPGRNTVATDETTTEVSHLTEMMRNSIQTGKLISAVNKECSTIYRCILCSTTFFLQAQFIPPNPQNGSSTSNVHNGESSLLSPINESSHLQYSEENNNPVGDDHGTEDAFFNENDDEMLFDPSSVSGTSIFVEESTPTGKHVTEVSNDSSDLISAALQCKVEIGDGTVEYDNDNASDNHTHGLMNEGTEYSETLNTTSKLVDTTSLNTVPVASSFANVEATFAPQSVLAKSSISENEIKQLELKSLQFIKQQQGQFVCIVCQRVSKLRRNLVEHVRRVHLCGEVEEKEVTPSTSGKTPGVTRNPTASGKDYYEEIVRRAVSKFFDDKREPSPPTGKRTLQDRASRFIRPDGYEFFCTICKVRSTKSERLINHISSVHFGEPLSTLSSDKKEEKKTETDDVLRCPGCQKVMPSKAFKARHMPRCSLAKRLCRRPGRPAGSGTKPPQTSSRYSGEVINCNFYIDSDGKVKRKMGRPFRNPAPVIGPRGEKYVVDPCGKPVASNALPVENLNSDAKHTEDLEPDVTDMSSDVQLDNQKQLDNPAVYHLKKATLIDTVQLAKVNVKPPSQIQKKNSISKCTTNSIATSKATANQSGKNVTKLDKSGSSNASNKNDSLANVVFRPEDVKKLIIPWSIGGKYSFSKCKECSVLFNKYVNAEAHVRNVHLAALTELTKDTSLLDDNSKGKQNSAPPSPPSTPPPYGNAEEENSPEVSTPSDSNIGKHKKRRRIIVESDSEEDEGGVYDSFSPMEYSNDEEEDKAKESETTHETVEKPVSSQQTMSTTQSQVLNKFRPFSAFQAGDARKKYLQPKRVSKALTSLTSKEFTDAQKFIVKIENCGYECRGCGGKFPRLNAISRHVRLKHFVERPYHCTLCDERFFHLNEFEIHKSGCAKIKHSENHISKKPKLLAQSWSDNSTTVKSRDLEPEASSDDVEKTFENIEDAKNFIESLSKKKYRCMVCKLTFGGGYSSCLKHIRRIHFGEKPYHCTKCNESFRYDKTYYNHVEVCGTGSTGAVSAPNEEEPALSKETNLKPATEKKSTENTEAVPEEETFKCKLCNEVSSDKPLFRYHLVSVHYGELSKGKASSFFDMIEDIIDTLAIKVQPKKISISPTQEKKKGKTATKLNRSKKRAKAVNSEQANTSSEAANVVEKAKKSEHIESGPVVGESTKTNTTDESDSCEPAVVHKDEKHLLASLPNVISSMRGTPFKKITVRLKPLIFKGTLPECLISAAKSLCGKRDAGTFQCKNCGRCFGTYQGVLLHVRIQHYGERRYQCNICHKFLADGLKYHREKCLRTSRK